MQRRAGPVKPAAPAHPRTGFSVAITGHRASHAAYPADAGGLQAALGAIMAAVDAAVGEIASAIGQQRVCPTRMHSLLADGADALGARLAIDRGWQLVSPIPFGRNLARAIHSRPVSAADARSILAGGDPDQPETLARLRPLDALADAAKLFELQDQDAHLSALLLATLDRPQDFAAAQTFALEAGMRFALSGRMLIEQSHLLIAIWDGHSTANVGGTGHTVSVALDLGVPVLWIDTARPDAWRILHVPEALATCGVPPEPIDPRAELRSIVRESLLPPDSVTPSEARWPTGLDAIAASQWRRGSSWRNQAYARVEAVFGATKGRPGWRSLRQRYETPDEIEQGSAAPMLAAIDAIDGIDPTIHRDIVGAVLRRFAWADGISTHLSQRYRSGMTVNFLLASLAIISGIAYLPVVEVDEKWIFASVELLLLLAIIAITVRGQRQRLHQRWFETRRVAEYFRHSPLTLAFGVSRSAGQWPRGTETSWPEWYVRQSLREIGLPHARLSQASLRQGLIALRDHHVAPQRAYHAAKAAHLNRVHHRLEHLSDRLFGLAVLTVAVFLVLAAGMSMGGFSAHELKHPAKWFTVLAVALPTLGGALAGLRFFGDFERFGAISEVTAEKLSAIEGRIALLLSASDDRLCYGALADLLRATDAVVISEIENWQSVFSAKRISVPV